MKLEQIAAQIVGRRQKVQLTEDDWLKTINALTALLNEHGITNRIRLHTPDEIPIIWDSLGLRTFRNSKPEDRVYRIVGDVSKKMLFPTRERDYALSTHESTEISIISRFLGLGRDCNWFRISVRADLLDWKDSQKSTWVPRLMEISSEGVEFISKEELAWLKIDGRRFLEGMCEAINRRIADMKARMDLLSDYLRPARTILECAE